ncbi:MAG TPA: hypothetical protein VMT85_12920 [Thermoanaerobaculia bacterium]|nr:hypothetical protein [Thermoanaerobaculia bacterium]
MSRPKKIRRSEFEAVFVEDWEPVTLQDDAIPSFARRLAGEVSCTFIASGQTLASVPYVLRGVPDATLVGGIDVWRDSPDDPVAYNKDWYAVLASETDPEVLFVDGPQRDAEHWRDAIPSRYADAKVIGGNDDGHE